MVEVRLYPTISPAAIKGQYQITEYVPSGLRIVTPEYVQDAYGSSNNQCSLWYPYEIDGQIVKYSIDKEWLKNRGASCARIDYINYYARVVTPGIYTAEPDSIENFNAESIRNYSTPDKITISY